MCVWRSHCKGSSWLSACTRLGILAILFLLVVPPGKALAEGTQPTSSVESPRNHVPSVLYIPTPFDVADQMLRMAAVTKDDVVYDLGCGDGRIVIAAAQQYGCRSVGVDIDPLRVEEARKNVQRQGVESLVIIRRQNLYDVDLREATVVTLYLSTRYNTRLVPQLDEMQPGSRVISHLFGIEGIAPDRTIAVRSKYDRHQHKLLLWSTPLKQKP